MNSTTKVIEILLIHCSVNWCGTLEPAEKVGRPELLLLEHNGAPIYRGIQMCMRCSMSSYATFWRWPAVQSWSALGQPEKAHNSWRPIL